jgi:hypothetical protein
LAQEQSFPFAAGAGAFAEQARRQNARVVQDEQVAGVQQIGQFDEVMVMQRTIAAPRNEKPGVIARRAWLLRDEIGRQNVVEEEIVHGKPLAVLRSRGAWRARSRERQENSII